MAIVGEVVVGGDGDRRIEAVLGRLVLERRPGHTRGEEHGCGHDKRGGVVARSIHDVGLGAGRRGVGAEFDRVEAKEVFGDRRVWRRGIERVDETLVSGGTLAGEEVVDWKPVLDN